MTPGTSRARERTVTSLRSSPPAGASRATAPERSATRLAASPPPRRAWGGGPRRAARLERCAPCEAGGPLEHRQQRPPELRRTLVAPLRVLGERPRHKRVEASKRQVEHCEQGWRFVQVRPEHRQLLAARKRRPPAQTLVEQTAERVHVRSRVDRLA